MPRSGLHAPLVLLTSACVALASVLGLQLAKDKPSLESTPLVAPKAVPGEAVSAPVRFSMPPLSTFGEIGERPLFSRSRRPAAPDESLGPAAQRAGALVLNGVILTGRDRIALLAAPESDRMTPLREGDTLAGWTLVSVYPDKVVIRSSGAEQEIFIADALKMNDSLARRRAEQLRAQQLRAQLLRQQARQAPQQPIVGGKSAEPATGEPPADSPQSPERPPEQKQNQQEERDDPEQKRELEQPGDARP